MKILDNIAVGDLYFWVAYPKQSSTEAILVRPSAHVLTLRI